jgi:predicted DNA-binding transcriptional regulator YafY
LQINRLFGIVYMLLNKKITTAKELSEHFEVSPRTIYRDIEILCQSGIPIYMTKGKGGGISLMENFILNKSFLSEEEQQEILSALNTLQITTNADTKQILNKLNAFFGDKQSDWIEVDFSNWNNNEEERLKFDQLKEAILKHHVISFLYYNSSGQKSQRTVEPYKMIFRGQAWYLYGYCRDKKDFRYFKITRIRELQIQMEYYSYQPEKNHRTMEPIEGSDTPSVEVLLRIDSQMGYRVYDEFPQEAITINKDGSFTIKTMMYTSNSWIYSYIMSYEDHIEVLQPEELRKEIVQRYQNVLKKYYI